MQTYLAIKNKRKLFLIILLASLTPSINSLEFFESLIPYPAEIEIFAGKYKLSDAPIISYSKDARSVAKFLAEKLQLGTEEKIYIAENAGQADIRLELDFPESKYGKEGYRITINGDGGSISASANAGLFYGCQTLLQMINPKALNPVDHPNNETLTLPFCIINDKPRFEWRGVMLDVARHFFSVKDVKRFIDLIAMHKLNRLHLHLTDDQGWRIWINSWPDLAQIGGSAEVGGGDGGYYSREEFMEIVDYAGSRFVEIIPEIEMPGHINAALASYPELNHNGVPPSLYEGTNVGFSCLTINNEITYKFVRDAIREIASLSPSTYIHIGGDEVFNQNGKDYAYFISQVQDIVLSIGKIMIGWEEISKTRLDDSTIVQFWKNPILVENAIRQGIKIILTPSCFTYLDMKYDANTPLGQDWAGYIDTKKAYCWFPIIEKYNGKDVFGIEAAIWSEFIYTIEDLEFMAFPRLAGIAEIAWSPQEKLNWISYKKRLSTHGKRLETYNINFYRSALIDW